MKNLVSKRKKNKIRLKKHDLVHRKIFGSPGQVFQIKNKDVTVCCGEDSGLKISELEIDGRVFDAAKILNSINTRLK